MLKNAKNMKNSGEANATIFDRVTENIPPETLGEHSGDIQETLRRGESHDPRQGSLKMNIGRHSRDTQKTFWRTQNHDPRQGSLKINIRETLWRTESHDPR